MNTQRASIDYAGLRKGDSIDAETAWNFFALLKPSTYETWLTEYHTEELAKATKLGYVLMQVRDWIEKQRTALKLPPLVMTTKGNAINVLHDDEASVYLSDQAFSGLRRHAKYTARLISAVDESQLSSAVRRAHENRIRTHSFVLASTQGAQTILRKLKRNGKEAPQLSQ